MTALLEVACHVPAQSVPIGPYLTDRALTHNAEPYQRYYGFGRVHNEPGGSLAGLLTAAAEGLKELQGREKDVRYVAYGPTMQLTAPYPGSPVRAVRDALGLRRALPISLTQHACASALLAVDVCGKLLAEDDDPDALALVLAGEKTFTDMARVIPHSAVLGEGAAAVLVSAGGANDRLLAYAANTLGQFHTAPYLSPELEEEFHGAYTDGLVAAILAAVRGAGLDVEDISLLLPHNVNRMSWLRILRKLGMPKDHIYLDNQREYGHCFGADSFVNFRSACDEGRLRTGDYYVMTAAGLGATLSAMVFRH